MNDIEFQILMKSFPIKAIKTSRTLVEVYETDVEIGETKLFIIKSSDLKTDEEYIRFGNKTQVQSIMNTYKKEKRFELL